MGRGLLVNGYNITLNVKVRVYKHVNFYDLGAISNITVLRGVIP